MSKRARPSLFIVTPKPEMKLLYISLLSKVTRIAGCDD
jgi:hypothetical protein